MYILSRSARTLTDPYPLALHQFPVGVRSAAGGKLARTSAGSPP